MSKEAGQIPAIAGEHIGVKKESEVLSVDEAVGDLGHRTLRISYLTGEIPTDIYVKIYNNSDPLFDNTQLSRSEAFALRRVNEVGVLVPRILAADIGGKLIGQPMLVISVVEGQSLNGFLDESPIESNQNIVEGTFQEIITVAKKLGQIKSPGNKFGNIFKPGWIGDIDNNQEYLRMGMLREFWRSGMIDESYVFQSDWAQDVYSWVSGVLMRQKEDSYQLCHGDLCANNIIGIEGNDMGFSVSGIIDWEFAHWGVPEIDLGDYLASVSRFVDSRWQQDALQVLEGNGFNIEVVKVAMMHRLMLLSNRSGGTNESVEIFRKRINDMVPI